MRLVSSIGAARLSRGAKLDRNQLFFWLFLIATGNGLAGPIIRSAGESGWIRASFDLFGVSAIVWVALIAGLHLLLEDREGPPMRSSDPLIAVLILAIALAPVATASAIGLTGLALYGIWTSNPGSPLRRAAIIFLAITGTLVWGRLLLGMLSRPLLDIDAFFVAHLVGTRQDGNLLSFTNGSGRFVIAPGCSSLQGMSLALVFWATVNQWFRVPFGWRSAAWCLVALAATVAINVLRLGAIAHFPEHFDAIHKGIGWHIASWTTLAAVVAICLYGARREVFARD